MKKALITSCSSKGYWYADKIGEVFEVVPEYYLFLVDPPEIRKWKVVNTILTIDLKDCIIYD